MTTDIDKLIHDDPLGAVVHQIACVERGLPADQIREVARGVLRPHAAAASGTRAARQPAGPGHGPIPVDLVGGETAGRPGEEGRSSSRRRGVSTATARP